VFVQFCASAVLLGCVVSSASADMTNFRDWVDANGMATNSTSNLWYGTSGLGGPMMASTGSGWNSPGYPVNTPMIGGAVAVGSNGGAAGTATFEGLWCHPGSGTPAVLVYAPQSTIWTGGLRVRSELIVNGLSGNGVTFTVLATIGGFTSNLGTTTLTGSNDRLDFFSLGGMTQLNAGDTLSVVIGDNGSYLYDHVNFNAWLDVPAPGAMTALLAFGAAHGRRRRR
jgi:hypothetical protein